MKYLFSYHLSVFLMDRIMANSNRNPRNLRDFIEKSKFDSSFTITGPIVENNEQILEESLRNLKNLSQEEKTETGMLKTRIDEQSRLIMVLKQRGDEYIRKNMTLEKLNVDLLEKRSNLKRILMMLVINIYRLWVNSSIWPVIMRN